jgi:hypothetical protein
MKKKNFISLSVSLAFLSLAVSGLLLYIGKKPKPVETIHVIFGLTFLCFAIFHIINNWSSLVSYMKTTTGGIKKEFPIVLGGCTILLLGAGFMLPPFEPIAEAGKALFRGERRERVQRITFEGVTTNKDVQGTGLNIILQKNNKIALPVITVWVEDSAHQFVENLFVPAKVASVENGEDIREAIEEGEIEMKDLTPGLLPVWNAKAKSFAPNFDNATPMESFVLTTKTTASGTYTIYVEIKGDDKTEVYEAIVDTAHGDAFKLKSKDGSLLERALIEIQ